MERAIDFYKAIPILSSVWNILTGVSSGAAKDGRARKRRMRSGKGYLGVWDPTGEEVREGSGLPVERGSEEIRLRCFSPGEGSRELERGELGAALADGGCGVWIDFLRPRDEARGILAGDLGLGSLVVEDCLSPLRMPKMDTFEGGAFVAAFAARLEQEDGYRAHLRAVEVDLLVGENYLVTVRDGPVREIEDGLGRRLSKARDARRNEIHEGGPGERLAHAALDSLVDGHLPALVGVAAAAEELEEGLDPRNERASTSALESLILLRRDLSAFRRLAIAQQESLRRLGRWSLELEGPALGRRG